MNDTIKHQLIKYPYLKMLTKYFFFITKEELETIKNSQSLIINNTPISIQLLINILTNDEYYNYTYRFFTNKISSFKICNIINGDTANHLTYHKLTIINGLSTLIENNLIPITPDILNKYEVLKKIVSFDNFQNNHQNTNYQITIDNITYSIPITSIINTLLLPPEEFNNLCTNQSIKTIHNIPKEHYLYATYHLIEDYQILTNYLIPSTVTKYYYNLKESTIIDLQALNQHLKTNEPNLEKIKLHNDLESTILRGTPETSTPLEKAIYIYLKMCKLLTYDEEYYLNNQTGPTVNKHQDINYIQTITPSNNSIVCFEFNLIFAYFLNKLGINFSINADYTYGNGHANLEFRYNNFLIRADSVTSILNGDLFKTKINQPLSGLKCLNNNNQTNQAFNKIVYKMYQLIINQENNHKKNTEHLDKLLNEYRNHTTNIKKIPLKDKLSILIEKVNSTNFTSLNSLSYILQLRKIIFNQSENTNNFKVTILKNNQTTNKNKSSSACAIFSINSKNFDTHPHLTTYYYYIPNNKLIPISHTDLQTKFNNQTLEYINNTDPRIPNITEIGGYIR